MPLRPVFRENEQLPLETFEDVEVLLKRALRAQDDAAQRRWGEHFFYLAAIAPHLFQPLQQEVAKLDDAELMRLSGIGLDTWCYLMHGASEGCVERLTSRLHALPRDARVLSYGIGGLLTDLLAGIDTEDARIALATFCDDPEWVARLEQLGLAPHGTGAPVERRFPLQRKAMRAVDVAGPREELFDHPHPVGLPIREIASEKACRMLTWHYVSLTLDEIVGLPAFPQRRIHLVSARHDTGWKLIYRFDDDGLCDVVESFPRKQSSSRWLTTDHDDDPQFRCRVVLVPFDDRLEFCNSHVFSNPIFGVVGGPPLGLMGTPPRSPATGKIMFHVATVSSGLREYGNGFRSLFLCEDSGYVGCQGCGFN